MLRLRRSSSFPFSFSSSVLRLVCLLVMTTTMMLSVESRGDEIEEQPFVRTANSFELRGSGATFPAPLYTRWFDAFRVMTSSSAVPVSVSYAAVGSGSGVRAFRGGNVDFAASDEPLDASDGRGLQRGVVQFPAVGGTIAIAYHQPGCSKLDLTPEQAARVFLGTITSWSQLGCGSGPITVVYRSDRSGTTFAFTNSLASFSSEWKERVGVGNEVSWPVGKGANGNGGVANVTRSTIGSISYLNLAFVDGVIVRAAAVQNRAGRFVTPTADSGTLALANIKLDALLAGEDPNPNGLTSYPISTLTWIIAYQSGNKEKARYIRSLFQYMLSDAVQSQADSLGYVPLSGGILAAARLAVQRIGL